MYFYDRKEAGKQLADRLKDYKGKKKTIVLALPRGGVPVAFEVAKELNLPLDVFLVRKLGIPGHEETAMGAIAVGDICILNNPLIAQLKILHKDVNKVIESESKELERRNSLYRAGRPALDLKSYNVILIDDGIATGATIKVAVEAVKKQSPTSITIATPVTSAEAYEELSTLVDETVALIIPKNFQAVGLWYQYFPQTSDQEVQELLSQASTWEDNEDQIPPDHDQKLISVIRQYAHPIVGASSDYDEVMKAAKDRRIVLIGESTHGTKEFYNIRAEITKRLIAEEGFDAVAIEGDWPDVYHINRYVNLYADIESPEEALSKFERFPIWMWQNKEVSHFIKWLHDHNQFYHQKQPLVGFYGLDLYSMQASIDAVIKYLQKIDGKAAEAARQRYSCLESFMNKPQFYGYASQKGLIKSCEQAIIKQLLELQANAFEYVKKDGFIAEDEFFYAEQNARLVRNAEKYYRSLYEAGDLSWNLRDTHMAETLDNLLNYLGRRLNKKAKIVVWAHNSHIGDARATAMSERSEINLGQLAREKYGEETLLIGFSTYNGTVTAASNWDGPTKRKAVLPALPGTYSDLFHRSKIKDFILNFRDNEELKEYLSKPQLQRFIGVIYRPDTEYYSHYYEAKLSEQFDIMIHIDHTNAVEPLKVATHWKVGDLDETYPFGI